MREKENEKRRKLRKGKVVLTIVCLVVLIAVIVAIVLFIKNRDKDNVKGGEGESEATIDIYDLPDITYSDMQVTNIEMEYLKNNDETMVSMIINNTTENEVNQESLTAMLLDKDGNILGQTRTYIEKLSPGEQYSISVILKGDLTATTKIQLQK